MAASIPSPKKVAVLGSTRGSSLQPVIDAIESGKLNAKISGVISNRKQSIILQRARSHGLNAIFVPSAGKNRSQFDADVTEILREIDPHLILCIGYMRILSASFVKEWHGKAVNVHPSLLPKHGGLMDIKVHRAVLDAGDGETGCTLHLIDEGVDSGPILIQKEIPVLPQDTPETLKAKVQPLEGQAFIELIRKWPMEGRPQS